MIFFESFSESVIPYRRLICSTKKTIIPKINKRRDNDFFKTFERLQKAAVSSENEQNEVRGYLVISGLFRSFCNDGFADK